MGSRKLTEKDLSDRRRMAQRTLAIFNASSPGTEFSREELFGTDNDSATKSWSTKVLKLLQNLGFIKRSGTFSASVYAVKQIIPLKEELIAHCVRPPARLIGNVKKNGHETIPKTAVEPDIEPDEGDEQPELPGMLVDVEVNGDSEVPETEPTDPGTLDSDPNSIVVRALLTLQAILDGMKRIEIRMQTFEHRLMAVEEQSASVEKKVGLIHDEWTGQNTES